MSTHSLARSAARATQFLSSGSNTFDPLQRAVRQVLAVAAVAAATAAPLQAQDRDAGDVEEVVVTGSRIRRVDHETPSPVQLVSREEILRSGQQNISDVIRNLISADNQGSLPTAFSAGFAAGSSAVSLRGLGVNSTLVLVNGRRLAQYGLSDDGVRALVDLNSIPMDAVERVEVLKDGGSAVYGSDAVAGVINIILRDRYEGATLGGDFGTSTSSDGNHQRVYGIVGTGSDRYNMFVTAEVNREDAISHRDRGGYLGTNNLSGIGFFDNRRGALAAGLGMFADGSGPAFSATTPYGSVRVPGGTQSDRINLLSCPEVSAATGMCVFDLVDYQQIQPKVERFNVYARGTFNFTDTLEGYTELGYFKSQVRSIGTPGSVNDTGVYDPANTATPITHTTTLPAGHPDNPTGVDRTLSLLTTMLGGRNGEQESTVVRSIVGLTGKIGGWEWDAGVGYIRSELTDRNFGFVRHPVLQAALNDGTFRIDPALNSRELLNAISPTLEREPTSSVSLVDASISGEIFDLPGGPLAIAAGSEFRKEKADTPPVPFTDVGEIVGLGYSAYSKEREVFATYVEVNAPVVSWAELNAALRYDHYDDVGSSTTPKVGVKFKPTAQLALRGTYSESFRAPGPAESGNSATFGFTNIGILTVGNPDLTPEEAQSYTAGIIYEPREGTNISVDYYNIKRDREIVAADQATVIGNLPTQSTPNSQAPGALPNSFLFFDENGDLGTISAPFVNATKTKTDGIDFDIRQRIDFGNVGRLTAGLTWTHVFSFTRQVPGSAEFEYAGTHGPYTLSSASGTPADRARLQLSWDRAGLSVTAALNYVSGMDNIDHKGETLVDNENGTFSTTTHEGEYFVADLSGKVCGVYNPDGTVRNNCRLDAFLTVDLTTTYALSDAWRFSGSITNLLDEKAPFDPYTYGGLNYNPAFHQSGALGRFFTLGMQYNF
jgi:iron complex outermembrane receptor protein